MDNQSDSNKLALFAKDKSSPTGAPIFWEEDFPVVSPLFSPEKNRKRLAEANISEEQMKRELEELKFADAYWYKINYTDEPLAASAI